MVPLFRGLSSFRVSFIGGFTVADIEKVLVVETLQFITTATDCSYRVNVYYIKLLRDLRSNSTRRCVLLWDVRSKATPLCVISVQIAIRINLD